MRRARSRLPWAYMALALTSGCVTPPHVGKDQGRAAVVWQNPLGSSTTPTPGLRGGEDTEHDLLAELQDAERDGREDVGVAQALYNLAILRRQQGAPAEAERLYRRALCIREREHGADHPAVAVVLNNLGALLAAQGNYAGARPLFQRALAIRQKTLGADHVLTAESLNNLALLEAAADNPTAAEPLYQRALSILEKAVPASPSALDRVLDNYAALLHETGRNSEAEALEAKALVLRATAGEKPAAP